MENLDDEMCEKFRQYVNRGKRLGEEGHLEEAIDCTQKALDIFAHEKIKRRLTKMKELLALEKEDQNVERQIQVGEGGYFMLEKLYSSLFAHQKEGVKFLWQLHKCKKGGILGDDMGLGKTIQTVSFLSGLFDNELVKHVLLVMPVMLLNTWRLEFKKWAPGIVLETYHGGSKKDRERCLRKIQRNGGVLLTSYGTATTQFEILSSTALNQHFKYDYVILDEGHKIKNPSTKTAKALHRISATHRLILTGTAVQNNLKELWALFNFVQHGQLLGTAKSFKSLYDDPISRAREKDATPMEQRYGNKVAEDLKDIINPFYLRRSKAQIKRQEKHSDCKNQLKMPSMTHKNDLVVWVFLSDLQRRIYEEFADSADVRMLLRSSRSPLVALVVLKKICDHPRLLSVEQCLGMNVRMDGDMERAGVQNLTEDERKLCAASRCKFIRNEMLIEESGKLVFLIKLIQNFKEENHRCLVFSQSRSILNIIQQILNDYKIRCTRLDGSIAKLAEREKIINQFKSDRSIVVFLLTTQVGGLGLTLTAADRAIIFDPHWNPATDAQAVDRVFRIGQEKDVVIYRLITCGSIEEKIYRRQVFKDSITQQMTGSAKNPFRYFTRQELCELFTLDDPTCSTTQMQLAELHPDRRTDDLLDSHIEFLHTLSIFGISDHDLMFSREGVDDDADENENDLRKRLESARQVLQMENANVADMVKVTGEYSGSLHDHPSRARVPSTQVPTYEVQEDESEALAKVEMDDLALAIQNSLNTQDARRPRPRQKFRTNVLPQRSPSPVDYVQDSILVVASDSESDKEDSNLLQSLICEDSLLKPNSFQKSDDRRTSHSVHSISSSDSDDDMPIVQLAKKHVSVIDLDSPESSAKRSSSSPLKRTVDQKRSRWSVSRRMSFTPPSSFYNNVVEERLDLTPKPILSSTPLLQNRSRNGDEIQSPRKLAEAFAEEAGQSNSGSNESRSNESRSNEAGSDEDVGVEDKDKPGEAWKERVKHKGEVLSDGETEKYVIEETDPNWDASINPKDYQLADGSDNSNLQSISKSASLLDEVLPSSSASPSSSKNSPDLDDKLKSSRKDYRNQRKYQGEMQSEETDNLRHQNEIDYAEYLNLIKVSREAYKLKDYPLALKKVLQSMKIYDGDARLREYCNKVMLKIENSTGKT